MNWSSLFKYSNEVKYEHLYFFRVEKVTATSADERKVLTPRIGVHESSKNGKLIDSYFLMCASICDDVLGKDILGWIEKIDSGELSRAEVDGNAWVTYISREKVWFEGLFGQGSGGAVRFEQYKTAALAYVNFFG